MINIQVPEDWSYSQDDNDLTLFVWRSDLEAKLYWVAHPLPALPIPLVLTYRNPVPQ